MKLLKFASFYPSYLKKFYSKHPDLAKKPYSDQKAALDYDAFGWADYWSHALTPLGYDVMEVTFNNEPMQIAWAKENLSHPFKKVDLIEIALSQIKKFKPDILWFEGCNASLFNKLLQEISSVRLVLGWEGSTISHSNVWSFMNLTLSCAPESVNWLRKQGQRAKQLHHGFDPRINGRLKNNFKHIDFSFIGQIIKSSHFHQEREYTLEKLTEKKLNIQIFSPSADMTYFDDIKAAMQKIAYGGMKILKTIGFPQDILSNLRKVDEVSFLLDKPNLIVNPKIKPFLQSGVFGLQMFQLLRDSKITLNIHADSSPTHASNMRLFETTGVGTCLITDWRENLHELFEIDKEVVAYKTADECAEKVRWLLDHPEEREAIARAGQKRTLKDHTFFHRAEQLDEIIKKELK